jgi:hypothetical protein
MSEIENFHMEPGCKVSMFQGFKVSRSKFQARRSRLLMLYSETLKL